MKSSTLAIVVVATSIHVRIESVGLAVNQVSAQLAPMFLGHGAERLDETFECLLHYGLIRVV